MKTKITNRDIKFFFIGLLAFFIIETVLNWEENLKSFNAGLRGGIESSSDD